MSCDGYRQVLRGMKMVHDHLYLHTLRARPAVKALQTIKDANVKRSVNW